MVRKRLVVTYLRVIIKLEKHHKSFTTLVGLKIFNDWAVETVQSCLLSVPYFSDEILPPPILRVVRVLTHPYVLDNFGTCLYQCPMLRSDQFQVESTPAVNDKISGGDEDMLELEHIIG